MVTSPAKQNLTMWLMSSILMLLIHSPAKTKYAFITMNIMNKLTFLVKITFNFYFFPIFSAECWKIATFGPFLTSLIFHNPITNAFYSKLVISMNLVPHVKQDQRTGNEKDYH